MTPERGSFEFVERNKVKGLTPSMVFDLYDIVTKFGKVVPEDQTVRYSSGNKGSDSEIFLLASIIPGNLDLLVAKSNIMDHGLEIMRTRRGVVTWDRALTIEGVKKAIIRIDTIASTKGLIDLRTGVRKPISPEFSIGKSGRYVVGEIFSGKGHIFVVPLGNDPEEYLRRFDHPEQLTTIPVGKGIAIILKEDLENIRERQRVFSQIIQERGLVFEDLRRLLMDDILKLRADVQRRVQDQREK